MTRIVEEETVIRMYEGNSEDSLILLNWWMELVKSGDLDKVLFPSSHPLGAFMGFFQPGKIRMVYVPDEANQIKLAAWGEVVANGVIFFSLWTRHDFRGKHGLQATLDIYNEIFKVFTVVMGVTKQERLLGVHKKLGYTIVAKVPSLWGGVEDGWLMQLTKDNFLAATGG